MWELEHTVVETGASSGAIWALCGDATNGLVHPVEREEADVAR